MTGPEGRARAVEIVAEQIEEATRAKKCHACGCFHAAVAAFEDTAFEDTQPGRDELRVALAAARAVLVEKKYDCLGCDVCFPAVAENAFSEAFPGTAPTPLCPTDIPVERAGWPPWPGDFQALRCRAPVAVCALNTGVLVEALVELAPAGLAIAGTLHTENLGIERIVRNVLANPHIRFLLVCGEDTRQRIGHLPGQSLVSLVENGIDDEARIRGARGKRPVLKNVSRAEIDAFRRQVELVALIGETAPDRVVAAITASAARDPGPFEGAPAADRVTVVAAEQPQRLVLDPAGFLVIQPDPKRGLVVEHYGKGGVLDCIVEGGSASTVATTAIQRGFVSRLDHAAYLGRELARAEASLRTGTPYVQDRAPEPDPPSQCAPTAACSGSS